MARGTRPIVFISYRWLDVFDQQGRRGATPDPRVREFADQLRNSGADVRLDVYFLRGEFGFRKPEKVVGDSLDPWLRWSAEQIAEADAVLLFCTPDYAESDPARGATPGDWSLWSRGDQFARSRRRVPAVWWDWHAIAKGYNERPHKFIPVGNGPYHEDQIPAFVRGATYINLSEDGGFDSLLRHVRHVWRERFPRKGVFISYAHNKQDQTWLDTLMTHLSWLKDNHAIEIWTDRDIPPGALWHNMIQNELDRAKVAVLLVSPEFLASGYIRKKELPRMLEAAQSDGMTIFWIPVRPSAYEHSPIMDFQAAHMPSEALSNLPRAKREQAFVRISDKLGEALGVAV